jgi:DNA-binding PadR family transcriptional regulator
MGRFMGVTSIAILATLDGRRCYGLDIIDRTALLAGTVYTTLRRHAEVAEAERRPRRRYYALTAKGAEELTVARDRLAGVVSAMAGKQVGKARGA